MMELTEEDTPSNTQAFRCFHIIQAPKIIREFTPLLYSFFTFFITLCHHSAKLCSHWLGMQSPRLRGDRRLNYTCLAITHDTNKCWAVSSSWSHRGHRSGWGSPLLSSLSAVQHLLRIANQRKTLHLFGAQDFQSFPRLKGYLSLEKNPVRRFRGVAAPRLKIQNVSIF